MLAVWPIFYFWSFNSLTIARRTKSETDSSLASAASFKACMVLGCSCTASVTRAAGSAPCPNCLPRIDLQSLLSVSIAHCRAATRGCTSCRALAYFAVDERIERSAVNQEASADDAGTQFLVDDCLTNRPYRSAAIGCCLLDSKQARLNYWRCGYGDRIRTTESNGR